MFQASSFCAFLDRVNRICGSQWCAYAGMGTVWCWNVDWPMLWQKEILNTLTTLRGWDYMDEYVIDMIKIRFDTAESDNLVDFLQSSSANAIVEITGKQDNEVYAQLIEFMRGAYMFGMVFEMDRIGMR